MAGQAELAAAIDGQNAALADLGTALSGGLARVAEDIQALKDQIAQGVDLSAQIASLEANTAKVQEVAAALNALDPIPTPEPTPEG